jgi:hypothetical protein
LAHPLDRSLEKDVRGLALSPKQLTANYVPYKAQKLLPVICVLHLQQARAFVF